MYDRPAVKEHCPAVATTPRVYIARTYFYVLPAGKKKNNRNNIVGAMCALCRYLYVQYTRPPGFRCCEKKTKKHLQTPIKKYSFFVPLYLASVHGSYNIILSIETIFERASDHCRRCDVRTSKNTSTFKTPKVFVSV